MRFLFHPLAAEEFDQAVQYYEQCQPGLGLDLTEEVYAAIQRAMAYPDAGFPISEHTRRCLVNRFPYGVIYQAGAEALRIIAVANLHRRPNYWRDRE